MSDPAGKYSYDVATALDQGARPYQEDSLLADFDPTQPHGFAVLADGMGGHAAGDVASQMIVGNLYDAVRQKLGDPAAFESAIAPSLRDAVETANNEIADHVSDHPSHAGMGATVVVSVLFDNRLYWVSVGDSPLYMFRNGELRQINEDHSMAGQIEMMVQNGQLTPEQAKHHPDRNALTSVLMGEPISRMDATGQYAELLPSDVIVAASDGIQYLQLEVIRDVLARNAGRSSQIIADDFLQEIKTLGDPNQDNVSICVIQVSDGRRPATTRRIDEKTEPPTKATTRILDETDLSEAPIEPRDRTERVVRTVPLEDANQTSKASPVQVPPTAAAAAAPTPQNEQKDRKAGAGPLIIGVCAAVALGVGGLFLATGGSDDAMQPDVATGDAGQPLDANATAPEGQGDPVMLTPDGPEQPVAADPAPQPEPETTEPPEPGAAEPDAGPDVESNAPAGPEAIEPPAQPSDDMVQPETSPAPDLAPTPDATPTPEPEAQVEPDIAPAAPVETPAADPVAEPDLEPEEQPAAGDATPEAPAEDTAPPEDTAPAIETTDPEAPAEEPVAAPDGNLGGSQRSLEALPEDSAGFGDTQTPVESDSGFAEPQPAEPESSFAEPSDEATPIDDMEQGSEFSDPTPQDMPEPALDPLPLDNGDVQDVDALDLQEGGGGLEPLIEGNADLEEVDNSLLGPGLEFAPDNSDIILFDEPGLGRAFDTEPVDGLRFAPQSDGPIDPDTLPRAGIGRASGLDQFEEGDR